MISPKWFLILAVATPTAFSQQPPTKHIPRDELPKSVQRSLDEIEATAKAAPTIVNGMIVRDGNGCLYRATVPPAPGAGAVLQSIRLDPLPSMTQCLKAPSERK